MTLCRQLSLPSLVLTPSACSRFAICVIEYPAMNSRYILLTISASSSLISYTSWPSSSFPIFRYPSMSPVFSMMSPFWNFRCHAHLMLLLIVRLSCSAIAARIVRSTSPPGVSVSMFSLSKYTLIPRSLSSLMYCNASTVFRAKRLMLLTSTFCIFPARQSSIMRRKSGLFSARVPLMPGSA